MDTYEIVQSVGTGMMHLADPDRPHKTICNQNYLGFVRLGTLPLQNFQVMAKGCVYCKQGEVKKRRKPLREDLLARQTKALVDMGYSEEDITKYFEMKQRLRLIGER